jgi:cyanophycinase
MRRPQILRSPLWPYLALSWGYLVAVSSLGNGAEPKAPEGMLTKGPLVVIGGNEDGGGKILQEFVHLGGGKGARIVVIPVATRYFPEAGASYVKRFLRLGAKSVQVFHVTSKADADDEKLVEAISAATAVFFTGGDQARIGDRLRDTGMHRMIVDRHRKGLVLAGTSAGAAMMSHRMIVRGESDATPARDVVEIEKGMSFVRGVIIDMHFSERGRLGRLASALAMNRRRLGIGIDENTALVVDRKVFRVIGDGAVTILDAGDAAIREIKSGNGTPLALFGMQTYLIPAGFSFRFESGSPVPGGDDAGDRIRDEE